MAMNTKDVDEAAAIKEDPSRLSAVVAPGNDHQTVTRTISDIALVRRPTKLFFFGLAAALGGASLLLAALGWLLLRGIGIWGNNIPVAWAWDITNFVWWIGIGHAGTLISAILLLLRQDWRTSINRYAEAMTIFAVANAGLFPVFHMGRSWIFYWLLPYPNTMQLWPQPRSPLVWDVFAVSTYASVSFIFWYMGMIPDFATFRDRARFRWQQIFYGALSLGWRGSARHWQRFEVVSLILAGICTPLVVSVHTVVSWDFAAAQLPGWHTTIFPPYFVAGAIYSGFAMVLTLVIPVRKWYGLEGLITMRHLEAMAKVMLGTGLIVAYGYIMEVFMAYYGGNKFEMDMMKNRFIGPYWPLYWSLWAFNILSPQLLWFKKIRTDIAALFFLSLIINVGMWLERFVIIVISLSRDFLPSSWGFHVPTFWEISTFVGTLGFFLLLMFLFVRFLPIIAIFEMRGMVPAAEERPKEVADREKVRV